ncbi:MAG UNVERIFIED_CONTAM: DUF29 domain-containing protein [Microcystis novacekii LVE1205-3]
MSDSPSLKPYWEQVFLDCYATALKSLRDNPDYQSFNFPDDCPFPQEISQYLTEKSLAIKLSLLIHLLLF